MAIKYVEGFEKGNCGSTANSPTGNLVTRSTWPTDIALPEIGNYALNTGSTSPPCYDLHDFVGELPCYVYIKFRVIQTKFAGGGSAPRLFRINNSIVSSSSHVIEGFIRDEGSLYPYLTIGIPTRYIDSTPIVSVNTWNLVEFYGYLSSTTDGSVIVHLNGAEIINETSIRTVDSNAADHYLWFGGGATSAYLDDITISSTPDWDNDTYVLGYVPSANEGRNEWSPTPGSDENYEVVDGIGAPAVLDASYVMSDQSNQTDLYNLSPQATSGNYQKDYIQLIALESRLKIGETTEDIRIKMLSLYSSSQTEIEAETPTTDFLYYFELIETIPGTTDEFTNAVLVSENYSVGVYSQEG